LIDVGFAVRTQIDGIGRTATQAFSTAVAGGGIDGIFRDGEPFAGGQAKDEYTK